MLKLYEYVNDSNILRNYLSLQIPALILSFIADKKVNEYNQEIHTAHLEHLQ